MNSSTASFLPFQKKSPFRFLIPKTSNDLLRTWLTVKLFRRIAHDADAHVPLTTNREFLGALGFARHHPEPTDASAAACLDFEEPRLLLKPCHVS